MSNTGFPQRQYSADSLDVKSKIASFEAFSESNTGLASPTASSALVSNSPSMMSRSSQQQQEQYLDPEPKESTTAAASQSRKSRLQRAMNGKRHIAAHHHQEPGSLMQKRLHAKEQRLASLQQQQQQQQQQQFSSSTSHEQQQMQQQRTAKEQRQPSSRHGNSRGQHPISSSGQQQQQQSSSQQQQQMSPMNAKALTSPSSLSQSRSPAHPRMQQQQTSPARRPNFNAATAAAKQHRALNYGKSSEAKSRSPDPTQQQQQQWGPNHPNNTSSSSSSHTGSSKGKSDSNMSRMSRLKAKGIDHNRFTQQRKQQQQQQFQQQPQQRPQHVSTPQRSLQATQHQTAKSQDSPDHNVLTDDDATLTSVSRVLDEQQAFTSNNNTNNINDINRHASYSASNAVGVAANDVINGHGQPGKPPRLWTGGEEKSEKFHSNNHDLSPTPQHHHQHHAQHSNHNNHLHHHSSNGGIYPRPSSSSEFEPEVQNSRQRAAGSRTGSSYQNNNDNPYAMPQGQFQQQQQQQQYAPTASRYHSPQHHYHQQQNYPNQHPTSAYSPQGGMLRRSQGSYPNNSSSGQQHFYQNRLEDDDRTFDYGVKDDDSQGSTTFQQQLLEAERKAREQSHVSEANTATMSQSESPPRDRHDRDHDHDNDSHAPRLLKSDDPLEQYRQSMENPVTKTAAGVIGAATLGCFVIGPVGVLLGAAAVGIGIGVMQIPEEQRKNMVDKASETMSNVQEQAFSASETMSMSCAASYKDSGLAEHIPAEMTKFCAVSEDDLDMTANTIEPHIKSEDSEAARLDHTTGHAGGGGGDHHHLPNQEARKPISPSQARSLRSKNVACLRHVRIVSASQIHGMDPALQPRAWLDLLASADTSNDEKAEAMEEILILAKDKQRARVFLEEGILDSVMWILSRYFEKENRKPTEQWSNPDISPDERCAAKLAATCCVTLGKAHCAAIHTEGDLLLMSMYERGTVPEERQLAQMLHEVPHHARVTKTNDPTIIDPSMEVFALKQLTLPQAEDLAKSVKALADGRSVC